MEDVGEDDKTTTQGLETRGGGGKGASCSCWRPKLNSETRARFTLEPLGDPKGVSSTNVRLSFVGKPSNGFNGATMRKTTIFAAS